MDCKIPAIGIASSNIVQYATGYVQKYQTGMPIRYVSVPFPFTGQPRAVDVGYVTGKDMLTGQPMMTAIVKALSDPLTAEEKISGSPEAEAEPRFLAPDSEENLRQLFEDREWTDFNSIVLPTEKRVTNMLKGTSRKASEVIKTINITGGARELTVEKVAISAVMAGA